MHLINRTQGSITVITVLCEVNEGTEENKKEEERRRRRRLQDENKQPPDRCAKLPNVPVVGSDPRWWDMAEQQSEQHGLSEVPSVAVDHNRSEPHGGVAGGFRRRLLPEHVPDAAVPGGDVRRDRGADRVHHIRVRGDGQRVGSEGDEPGVFGVQLGGLFGVVGRARGE